MGNGMRFKISEMPDFIAKNGVELKKRSDVNLRLNGGDNILFLRYDIIEKIPHEWAQLVVLSGDEGVGGFDVRDMGIDLKANVGISAFQGVGAYYINLDPRIEITYAGDKSKLKPLIEDGLLSRNFFDLNEETDYGVSGFLEKRFSNNGMFIGSGRYISSILMQVIGSFIEADKNSYPGGRGLYNQFLDRNLKAIESYRGFSERRVS